jgi:pyrroloquinoline quinone biosynthesis protein B
MGIVGRHGFCTTPGDGRYRFWLPIMKWIAIDGHHDNAGPWRGSIVLRADDGGPGVLVDPTGALASRLDAEPALCHAFGLDRGPRAVVLTAARLDQVAALIGMRHGSSIDLYTSPEIFEDLSQTVPVLPELQRHCEVHWRMVPVAGDRASAEFSIQGLDKLTFTVVAGRAGPGSTAPLAGLPAPRKLLLGGVRDRAPALACLGIEQAQDGLEIVV